jgi:hypothetical protein
VKIRYLRPSRLDQFGGEADRVGQRAHFLQKTGPGVGRLDSLTLN